LTGLATWTFTSIDPATLDVPADPLAGFLPPDDNLGDGMGFVNYTIRPKSTLTTGEMINGQANVVFDMNPALLTAPIVNTIDNGPPTSSVTSLPPVESTTSFTVGWSGHDDTAGSGIASFDVFVSDNGAPFTPFLVGTTQTSASFTGQDGHTYGFYSVATDNVGNREATPSGAQATTQVQLETSTATTTDLASNHPSGSTYGQSVTFTVTVTSTTSATPSGSIQFQIDGSNFGNAATLSSGMASITTSNLLAGTHIVTAAYTSDSSSFSNSNSASVSQVVSAAPLTITANNQSMTYGGAFPSLTVSYSGFVNGDSAASLTTLPAIATTATPTSHVGSYTITASGAVDPNYTLSYVAGTLAITPAPLTITADNKSMVYGGTFPTLTASYGGFVNGDTSASLTTQPTLSTTATAASHVGSYTITAGGAVDPDYTISYVAGTLIVSPAGLTITADNKSKVYGAALPTLTASYSGFVNGDTAASFITSPTLSTTATASSHVGSYSVTASSAVDPDYTISYVAGTLTVSPAGLTITADNKSKAYGAVLPTLTASYNGFVNGDSVASLTTPPTLSTTATAASHVGTYTITASGAVDPDYSITYVVGTLAVAQAQLTITADNKTKVYGSPLPTLTASYSGFVNGDTTTSLTTPPTVSTTATANSNVGTYPISASGAVDPDYTINYVAGSLSVTPATPTVSVADAGGTYNVSAFPATGKAVGVDGTTAVSGSFSYAYYVGSVASGTSSSTAPINVGTYTVVGTFTSSNSNYNGGISAPVTFTIGKALLTVAGNNPLVQYSDPLPAFTPVYSGLMGSDTVGNSTTGSPSLTSTVPTANATSGSLTYTEVIAAPGNYVITAAQGSLAAANYTFKFVNGTLTVKQEDARLAYTGNLFVQTASTTSTTATVLLTATIYDISYFPTDPAYDPYPGTISKAVVTFVNRDTGAILADHVPVSLVSSSNPEVGTASASVTLSAGTMGGTAYTIGTVVGYTATEGYYTRNSNMDDAVVTVSQPIGTGFITGAGYVVASSSAGTYAAKVGTREYFGFNVKFNTSGTTLQGNFDSIVRATNGHVYLINSTSITSLTISGTTLNKATLLAKANLIDVTNPLNPVSIGKNYTLQVNMTDNGEPGTNDTIGIALWNGNTLLFSSNWTGGTTVPQKLSAGDLVVHHAQEVAGGASNGVQSSQVLTQQMLQPIVTEAIALWQEAGTPPSALAKLRSTPVLIADLPGADVGRESANGDILIDTNAAGYGWFVDPTPADNSEFKTVGSSPASGHVDLLTVVTHELGHVLGIAELSNPNDVMSQDLALGVRKMPTAADVAEAGLQIVAAPTFPAVNSVLAADVRHMSQFGQISASGLVNPHVYSGNIQTSEMAINPDLLNAIRSLVTSSAELEVLTNIPESRHAELGWPLPAAANNVTKPAANQSHQIIGEPAREQVLDVSAANFAGVSFDDDLLNQLVIDRQR
jgi:hypothetical protein